MKNIYVVSFRTPVGSRLFVTVKGTRERAVSLSLGYGGRSGGEDIKVQTLLQWVKEYQFTPED